MKLITIDIRIRYAHILNLLFNKLKGGYNEINNNRYQK